MSRAARRAARRGRRTLAALVCGLCVAVLPVTLVAAPADARPGAEPDSVASVDIASLTPAVPRPGDTLLLRGSVVNRSTADLRTVSVRLRLSPRPVTDRAELAALATGRAERTGNTLWSTQLTLTGALPAGESVPYELSVGVDTLGFSSQPGVQVLSVEALGDLVVGDGRGAEQIAVSTTFVPWFGPSSDGTPTVEPSGSVWLWPLTAIPAVDSDGALLDEALGTALAPGGRLRVLLDLAITAPVPLTLLVDPSLLEVVESMSDGYQVHGPDGLRDGTHAEAAARWLTELRALLARPTIAVAALAYAQPDIVALHRAGQDLEVIRTVTDAAARAAAVLQRPVPRTLPWPAGGRVDPGSLDLLRVSGSASVLLSSAALPPEQRTSVTPDGVAPLGEDERFVAVLADARLGRVLSTPTVTPAEAVAQRQRMLADLATITLEAPDDPRLVVVAPDPLWDADPGTVSSLWTALTEGQVARGASLAELLASPAAGGGAIERRQAPYRKRDERAELPQPYLARVAAQREQLSAFRAVTSYADVEQVPGIEDGLTRTESASWRDDQAGGRRLLEQVRGSLRELSALVRIVSQGTTTFPGETGVVPVVVANDLEVPVRVGVQLAGTPAIRFDAEPYPAFTVAPGTKASVEVPARVAGSGDVTVQVQLTTADGRRYGEPTQMVVRSTAYARAASWLVGALLVLLVALLTVNFVRRRRRPRPPLAPADGEPVPEPSGPDVPVASRGEP